jgi:broad specificity phosphatase PhoE
MGRIILARAGTTDYDDQHRIAGTLDLPLNCRGQAEAADLARDLRTIPLTVVYAAAGEASIATGQVLAETLDVKLKQLEDLHNQDFGLWQGLQLDELRRKHPRVYKQWEDDPCSVCPPNGEMVDQVVERVSKTLRPLLRRHGGDTIALVAPDPLRKLIRCYLKRTAVCHPWEDGGFGPLWEALEVSTNGQPVPEPPQGAAR